MRSAHSSDLDCSLKATVQQPDGSSFTPSDIGVGKRIAGFADSSYTGRMHLSQCSPFRVRCGGARVKDGVLLVSQIPYRLSPYSAMAISCGIEHPRSQHVSVACTMLCSKKIRKSVSNGTEADDDRLSWLMNWPCGLVRSERRIMLDPAYACAHYRARLAETGQDKPSPSSVSLCKQSVHRRVAMLRDIPHDGRTLASFLGGREGYSGLSEEGCSDSDYRDSCHKQWKLLDTRRCHIGRSISSGKRWRSDR